MENDQLADGNKIIGEEHSSAGGILYLTYVLNYQEQELPSGLLHSSSQPIDLVAELNKKTVSVLG